MPQQQRAVETRRNVLIGAAVAIDRHGYGASTIAEIVRESRITKGSLYFHFPSKEAVAEAIIAEQGEWLKARHNDDHEPVQAMLDLSYAFVEAVVSDPLMRASIRMTIDRAGPAASITQGYSSWIAAVTPVLVLDDTTPRAVLGPSLSEVEQQQMLDMLRAVVTEGGAPFLADVPGVPVAAKTGTAEFGEPDQDGTLGTHAWMFGLQGDLAVAVFVERGSGGASVAGPVLKDFLVRVHDSD